MDAKRGRPFGAPAGDTYDLAVGLRQRLAETVRPQPASVTSQLQSAARERLGSDGAFQARIASDSVRVAASTPREAVERSDARGGERPVTGPST